MARIATNVFAGLLFKFVLDVIYSLIYRNYPLIQPLSDYLFAILIGVLILEMMYLANRYLNRHWEWNKNPYKRYFYQWGISVGISVWVAFVLRWLYKLSLSSFYYVSLMDEIILLVLLLLGVSIIVTVELSLFLLNKWRFSLAELERFKKENAEFQFETLRSQVNPHFLFNSLNTLSSLIYIDKDKASKFIRELSDVYRYILEHRGKEMVSLDREIAIAKSYLYLLSLRFDRNLKVEIRVEENTENWNIAPLTLQLLIENAVKHNIVSAAKPLAIVIEVKAGFLTVKNNLQKKDSKEYSSELGLKNIVSRYTYLTDKKVEIHESEKEFLVKIPLIRQK